MEDGQFREAESEEQKSLPFNFRAPRLQLTQDKSQARIFWQSQGQIIADHEQQVVKSIGKTPGHHCVQYGWLLQMHNENCKRYWPILERAPLG